MKVLELLSDPKRWTKGANYRKLDGSECGREEAECYCVNGAAAVCYGDDKFWRMSAKIDILVWDKYKMSGIIFNDDPNTIHEMLIEVLKEAGI